MPLYELMCIARADVPVSSYAKIAKTCFSAVTEGGGTLRNVENMGRLPLAYRIKAHQRWNHRGHFFRMRMDANPSTLAEVEHLLRVDENMVRWLTIRRPTFEKPAKKKYTPGPFGEQDLQKTKDEFFSRIQGIDKLVAKEVKRKMANQWSDLLPRDVEPTETVKREILIYKAKQGVFDESFFQQEGEEEKKKKEE